MPLGISRIASRVSAPSGGMALLPRHRLVGWPRARCENLSSGLCASRREPARGARVFVYFPNPSTYAPAYDTWHACHDPRSGEPKWMFASITIG